MVAFIKEYVRTCDTCHRGKTSRSKPLGPLQPNEIPDAPMRVLTTDFIVGLPKVTIEGIEYDAIQVMADKHSKMVHLAATDETVDAERAAWHLIRDQVRLHGVPRKIISDRGPQFSSKLFRAVLKGLEIESALSTAYHPQTDGQSERWNQEIEAYLRMFCSMRRDDWAHWLPVAEFAFNT